MFKKILIANRGVIASEAKQSGHLPALVVAELDCRVASLLAMAIG